MGDHFINSHNLSVDNVWILLGENSSWSLLGLKRLIIMPFFTLGSLIAQRLVGLSKQLWQKKKKMK